MKTSLEEYYEHILKNVDFGTIKNTAFGILSDIKDRRGLSQEWDQIDEVIQEEIIQSWIDIIKKNQK